MPVPVDPVLPPDKIPSSLLTCLRSNIVYGLGLPADMSEAKPEGGLKAQTELAAQAGVIYAGLDDKAIPGIAKLKKGLYNDKCDPTVTEASRGTAASPRPRV